MNLPYSIRVVLVHEHVRERGTHSEHDHRQARDHEHPAKGYRGLFTTQDDNEMATAARLPKADGRADVESTIKPTYSKTRRTVALAVCYTNCGSLQGNFMVGEATLDPVTNGAISALDTLAVADCPVQDWQHLIHNPCHTFIIV